MNVVDTLDLEALPNGVVTRLWLNMVTDGLGSPECLPVVIAKGKKPGPVLGLTAAIHGNEINGIPVLHRLFERIDCSTLKGTIVGVLVVNIPGFHRMTRRFPEAMDLNHAFPGRPDGNDVQIYAHRLQEKVISKLDALLDLHTASFGRENCLYVRADMSEQRAARMAFLQRPSIIVHNPPHDGTLRGAAAALGIPAITVEIGDPHRFQERYIKRTLVGIRAVMMDMRLVPRRPLAKNASPIVCRQSGWVYTDQGGLLTVQPQLVETVAQGESIATLVDIFGRHVSDYRAPHAGVIIGRSTQPVTRTGARVAHIGEFATEEDTHILAPATVPPLVLH